ncbi:MAG: glycosyltransferase family 4 protein [Planctomycetota bacterium]|nr:glycosyltransferase family 4 protein [Planctomycetota bacterium]
MRIALLVDPLTLRSRGGHHAPALAAQLIARGHEVRGFGAPPGKVPHSVEYNELAGLSRFEPDVLVAYDGLSPTAFGAARVSRRSGARLILVEPGQTREATPLHERFLQGIGERLWGPYVRGTADVVVALDPVARDQAIDEGFAEQAVHVLPVGLDLELWRPGASTSVLRRHGLHGRVVLYHGPLETSVGLEDAISAFARTAGQHPDWVLAVSGKGAGRQALRNIAERQGVSASVRWLGELPEEDLPGLFASATLLIAPAVDDRPSTRPVLQALAAGVPVIASDVARYRWAVPDDVHGLLVPCPDGTVRSCWEAVLTRALHSPSARERWSRAARAWAEQHLDWRHIADRFEELMQPDVVEGDDAA